MVAWQLAQLLSVCALAALGAWRGIEGLRSIASDVVALAAVLAAFLVQVMLLLATILTPGRLSDGLFKQLADALDEKQKQAFWLCALYLAVLVGFLGLKLSDPWKPQTDIAFVVASAISYVLSFGLLLAIMRTVGLLLTLQQLQKLRHKLIFQDLTVERLKQSVPAPSVLPDEPLDRRSPPFG